MGLTPDIILRATGADTLEALYIGGFIKEDYTESRFVLTFTEERGITKFFAGSTGEVVLPAWVRPTWPKVTAMNLPITHLYAVVEEVVQGLNPGLFTMMQGQLQMMQQNTGVDLKRDVIESLGSTFLVAHVPQAGQEDSALIEQGENLIVISSTNPGKLVAAVETLGTMGGKMPKSMFETREYLGAKIYTMPANPRQPDNQVSFAIHGGQLLFTTVPGAHPLEAVLQSWHSGEGESLWEQPQVRQIIAELPPQAIGYAYHDMASMLHSMAGMFAKLQKQTDVAAELPPELESDEEDDSELASEYPVAPAKKSLTLVDPAQVPSVDQLRRYWSTALGGTWRDARSWTSITKISHRPAKP
jgi:Protein of unknown function (DUF3352)